MFSLSVCLSLSLSLSFIYIYIYEYEYLHIPYTDINIQIYLIYIYINCLAPIVYSLLPVLPIAYRLLPIACNHNTRYTKHTQHIDEYWQIGHRLGHQSGLYESPRQNPAAILNGLACRVYQQICTNSKYKHTYMFCFINSTSTIETGVSFLSTTNKHLRQACSAINRVWWYQYILKCNLHIG